MFRAGMNRAAALVLLAAIAAAVFAAGTEAAPRIVKAREAARGELSLGPGQSVPMVRMFFYTLNGSEQADALCAKMKRKFPQIDSSLKDTLGKIGKTKLDSFRYVVIFGHPDAVASCILSTAVDNALRGETTVNVARGAKLDFDRKPTASLGYMVVELPPSDKVAVLRLETPQGTALLQSYYVGLTERSKETAKMYRAMLEIARQDAAAKMYELGRWCENKGLLDEACRHYESALALDPLSLASSEAIRRVRVMGRLEAVPRDSAAFYDRAAALVSIARYDEAIEDLMNAIKLNPKMDKAHYLLAECLISYRKFDKAAGALDTAIAMESGEARYYSARALCRMFLGQSDGVAADMKAAEKIDPGDGGLLRLKAGELVAASLKEKDEDKKRKTLSGALDLVSRAIGARPDDYENYCARGMIHIMLDNWDYAFADAAEAFRLNPYHYRVHHLLGKYYLNTEEAQKAEACYNQAIANFPKLKFVFGERGKFYVLVGDLKAAEKDFTAAIALDGEDAESYYNRARVHLLRSNVDKALLDLDSALALMPNDTLFLFERARLNYEGGDLGAALKDLRAIVALDAANYSVYYMIGLIYLHKQDKAKALEYFRKALDVCEDEKFRGQIENQIKKLK